MNVNPLFFQGLETSGAFSIFTGKPCYRSGMKLQQGQLWKKDGEFLRIVECERLSVIYKSMQNPFAKEGQTQQVTKKEFCRLIKDARLLP